MSARSTSFVSLDKNLHTLNGINNGKSNALSSVSLVLKENLKNVKRALSLSILVTNFFKASIQYDFKLGNIRTFSHFVDSCLFWQCFYR